MSRVYVFSDYAESIGGIEVIIIDLVHYLCKKGEQVFFLTELNSKNIYNDYLDKNESRLVIINKKVPINVSLYSKETIASDRQIVLKEIGTDETVYIIATYFNSVQYLMDIFKNYIKSKLLFIWPHPLDWVWTVPFKPTDDFIINKIKNKKYMYQKELFRILSDNKAHYFSSRSIFDFNNWYYEAGVKPPDIIEALPMRALENKITQYHINRNVKQINILWVGRFAFFKKNAIVYIFTILEKLAILYPNYKIIYNIVGYGPENHTNYIKNNIKPKKIKVNFLGGVKPDNLNEIFLQNHIGIAMGVTVKQMAQAGLPAILIDTLRGGYQDKENCNWIFHTSEGDAGDGYYYDVMNKPLTNRRFLLDILSDVFQKPEYLNMYSVKSTEYVNQYYSFERQTNKILEALDNSTFSGNSYYVFRYNGFLRLLYRLYKNIQMRKEEKND